MQYERRRLSKVGVFLFGLLGALIGAFFLAPSAHAQGEHYQYDAASDTIIASGGALAQPATLKKDGDNYSGDIQMLGKFARVDDGNAATLTKNCTYTMEVQDIEGDLKQQGSGAGGGHKAVADLVDDNLTGARAGECKVSDYLGPIGQPKAVDNLGTNITIVNTADPRGTAACQDANATNPECQAGGGDDEAKEPDVCPISTDTALRWIFCPIAELADTMTQALDSFITTYLEVDNGVFADGDNGYHKSWETFRNFAVGVVVIAGLVMVVGEALNLEIIDAYTIRKVLPRLFIAVVGIAISWDMMRFLTGFFDDLGHAASSIIYTSFDIQPKDVSVGGLLAANGLILGGAAVGAFILGPLGLISMFGTIILSLLVAVAVLVARQAIIVATIVLAPLAIASYILPNTNKLANFWWNTFFSMMILYPIATGLIALCKVMGNITIGGEKAFSSLVGILFYFVGYALLPVAFRVSGGLIATIGGMANDRSRGAFDRLKKVRQNQMSSRYQDAVNGANTYKGSRTAGRIYRRATTPGGLTSAFSSSARQRYRGEERTHLQKVADEMLKNDNGRSANDDPAMKAVLAGAKTESDFIDKYRNFGKDPDTGAYRHTKEDARKALYDMESSMKARIGSDSLQVAAFKGYAQSTTGMTAGKYDEAVGFGHGLVNRNLMTASDAAGAMKGNKSRGDINAVGFGEWAGAFQSGAVNNQKMKQEAIRGIKPGDLSGFRKETITSLGPEMVGMLSKGLASDDEEQVMKSLAQISGVHDGLGQTSPQNAALFRKEVLNKEVEIKGKKYKVSDVLDANQGNQAFRQLKKVWDTNPARRGGAGP